jgi:hypothetical protein
MTRREMTVRDLQEDLELKEQIHNRLSFLKGEFLRERMGLPRRNDRDQLSLQSWNVFKNERQRSEQQEKEQRQIEAAMAGNNLGPNALPNVIERIQDFLEFCNRYRREQISPAPEDMIPEEIQEDPVLAENICPITLQPMRHPLKDPTTGSVYEARAIRSWVEQHKISPLSRQPLSVEDLQPVEDLESVINERLRFYNVL